MRAVLIGAVLLLGACGVAQAERVKLSGQDERRPVQVGAFDKVELKGPDRVDVRVGAAQSVSMSGDRAVLERMIVRVEDGKLIVERRDRNTRTNGDRERAVVSVTMPRVRAAATGGSAPGWMPGSTRLQPGGWPRASATATCWRSWLTPPLRSSASPAPPQ